MSSGNSYNYGDHYQKNYQQQMNEGSHQRPQELSQNYPSYPPTHPYTQMYYHPQMGLEHQHHQKQQQQQQQQQHEQQLLEPTMYNRTGQMIHQARYPGYIQFIPPVVHPEWTSPPNPAVRNLTFNSYSSNNNNNNYQTQVSNDWSQYQQSSWGPINPALGSSFRQQHPSNPHQSATTSFPSAPKHSSLDPVPPVSDVKLTAESTDDTAEEKEEEKEIKKPVPIMVGKRRGGRVLPTGIVKKPRTGSAAQGRTDAWGQYMAEVRKYKEQSCEEERKNRPLVK